MTEPHALVAPIAEVAELADATDLKSVGPHGPCGFDSRPRHQVQVPGCSLNTTDLVTTFIQSRRHGTSARTIEFYRGYLSLCQPVLGTAVQPRDIIGFLNNLSCHAGGRHAYYRVLRVYFNWLFSPRSGMNLNPQDNPILAVEAPKVGRRLMPSLTPGQIEVLMAHASSLRDRCILSLLADSGLRLSEVASVRPQDINWQDLTVTVIGKCNKQRRAPFTHRTAQLLQDFMASQPEVNGNLCNLWGMNRWGIVAMLHDLGQRTGVKCNAHAFRRGFACNLHRRGLSTLTIMHLGGWESLGMVERYTRSIAFEDCLQHYRQVEAMN